MPSLRAHAQIGEHEVVGARARRARAPSSPSLRFVDLVAGAAQHHRERRAHVALVVDDEDLAHGVAAARRLGAHYIAAKRSSAAFESRDPDCSRDRPLNVRASRYRTLELDGSARQTRPAPAEDASRSSFSVHDDEHDHRDGQPGDADRVADARQPRSAARTAASAAARRDAAARSLEPVPQLTRSEARAGDDADAAHRDPVLARWA